ncbi:putative Protein kinase domain [Paratrimastix pyriformis]|uniref:Protein kinase domain-containing protein n=1 Tax=Paratrimastix pyriformis TaxID=342808 RepID=A0ABQ8UCB2_9EUKA|nr:putative Protein kinase domain [Paratrimastix pyriformis]
MQQPPVNAWIKKTRSRTERREAPQLSDPFLRKEYLLEETVDVDAARREFELQKELNNDHILKPFFFYEPSAETKDRPVLIMEFCRGSMMDMMAPDLGEFPMSLAGFYFRQLCSALVELDAHHIIHRRVALSTMLLDAHFNVKVAIPRGWIRLFHLTITAPLALLQLAGFDYAKKVGPGEVTATVRGMRAYMAPEGATPGYTSKVDVWAAGVVLYVLLMGEAPFPTPEPLPAEAWPPVEARAGPEAARLLQGMLQVDPEARLSIEQEGYPAATEEAERIMKDRAMARRKLAGGRRGGHHEEKPRV